VLAGGAPSSTVAEAAANVSKVVFRVPPTANLAALLLAVTATPFAFAAPGLWLTYLVPIAIVVWVLRNRTTADANGLATRSTFGSRSLKWDDVVSLKLDRGRVSAVDVEGNAVNLPGVRVRHLSLLSRVSGGRVPDPAARVTAEDE
jgi:Bacterial PH domain